MKRRDLLKYWWWYIWIILFAVFLILWVYNYITKQDTIILNIEYRFYLSVFVLAAVSMSRLRFGKPLLWTIFLLYASGINNLPEMQQIAALNSCYEDNECDEAEKMKLVKLEGQKIIYIPKSDRK